VALKRGILIRGGGGYGKTSFLYMLSQAMKERGGISVLVSNPVEWLEVSKVIRLVEPYRPILVFMDDLEYLVQEFNESKFLDLLNFPTDNVMYIATVTNLNQLSSRILKIGNFNSIYEITSLSNEDRKAYLKNILPKKSKYDIDKLVSDTDKFTIAQMREVFISLFLLEEPYESSLIRIKIRRINNKQVGFGRNQN
jgi:SpoVK/Ycf46/Vps4 family AAA+-type ATPase